MDYNTIVGACLDFFNNRHQRKIPTVIILGPPGLGKTSLCAHVHRLIAAQLRADMGAPVQVHYEQLDQTTMEPVDMGGAMQIVNGRTDFAGQRWIERFCVPGAYGVIVLDDLTAADERMHPASRELVYERRIHGDKISDNVMIFVTGNRRSDKAGAKTLPSHFINACVLFTLTPNLAQWSDWYLAQGLPGSVLSFLNWRPNFFFLSPAQADADGVFPTGRSWAGLAGQLEAITSPLARAGVIDGFVGQTVGVEFSSFLTLRSEVPPAGAILDAPQRALPRPQETLDTPDKRVAMASNISEEVARRFRDGPKLTDYRVRLWASTLNALGWAMQGSNEYCVKALNGLGDHLTEKEYATFQVFLTPSMSLLDEYGRLAVAALQQIFNPDRKK